MAESRVFLRRFLEGHISKGGKVSPDAFACRKGEDGLSFTLFVPELRGPRLVEFQRAARLGSNDLPGFCKTPWSNLPPPSRDRLRIRHDPQAGEVWGDHHYLTECPGLDDGDLLAQRSKIVLYPVDGDYVATIDLLEEGG